MCAKKHQKNILFISFCDAVAFWKYKTLFGEELQTPNLDRICAQSTAFHAAYTQVTMCSPARASFMSGKSPLVTGITSTDKSYFDTIPPEELWPYTLKSNGYFNSSGGKVMLGYGPLPKDIHETLFSDRRRRFNMFRRKRFVDLDDPPDAIRRKCFGGFRGGEGTLDEADDVHFYDHQVADSALTFLDKYKKPQPFYREVGFSGPHGPWTTPARFKEMCSFRNIRKPAEWEEGFDTSQYMDVQAPENMDSSKRKYWKKSVRNYFSALTHADHHLGRVWDALKASRHAKNTMVVILSDHGLHLGERNRFRKHTLWEQVANVPLIIHDPDKPQAKVVTDPVGLIDVGPTVLDYLDMPPIPNAPGRSLRAQIDGAQVPDRAIPTFMDDSATIRKGRYRFIQYGDGTTALYDLEGDWWQTKNLGPRHPDYEEMRESHQACCRAYRQANTVQ